jgi:GNAT superfamily N-acetyltransferase
MDTIRRCGDEDLATMLAIVNAAALAYRGVIPADRWHEPYMPEAELRSEIAAGVEFWGFESDDGLLGIMGVQAVRDVDLIRHAYVRPAGQRQGVGAKLIAHFRRHSARRMLVGTWAAASWAIEFYQRNGFELVAPDTAATLLRIYWTIPARQIATSVVLANPPLTSIGSDALKSAGRA